MKNETGNEIKLTINVSMNRKMKKKGETLMMNYNFGHIFYRHLYFTIRGCLKKS